MKHKIKQATKTGTSRTLGQVLRKINPILRGWAAYFRYGASKQTFADLGWYAWWRMIYWIRRKHPDLTWKQIRRRYYGADRIREGKPESDAAWLALESLRKDMHTLTDESLETFRTLVLSLTANSAAR